jgi:hypothetical protein
MKMIERKTVVDMRNRGGLMTIGNDTDATALRMKRSSGLKAKVGLKQHGVRALAFTYGLLLVMGSAAVSQAHATGKTATPVVSPRVFQAAGPTVASIQSVVDEYRAALGATNVHKMGSGLTITRWK